MVYYKLWIIEMTAYRIYTRFLDTIVSVLRIRQGSSLTGFIYGGRRLWRSKCARPLDNTRSLLDTGYEDLRPQLIIASCGTPTQ